MSSGALSGKKILVVDDDRDVLEFLKVFLEANGFPVITAEGGNDAINCFEKGQFFLVIADIAMPQMDGYEIIEKLRKEDPNLQLSVMTGFGYNPNHTLVRISQDFSCPCLFKPFNRKKVMDVVSSAFQNHERMKDQ